jgi:hypothetical protein
MYEQKNAFLAWTLSSGVVIPPLPESFGLVAETNRQTDNRF